MSLLTDADYLIQRIRVQAFKDPTCKKLSTFLPSDGNPYLGAVELPDRKDFEPSSPSVITAKSQSELSSSKNQVCFWKNSADIDMDDLFSSMPENLSQAEGAEATIPPPIEDSLSDSHTGKFDVAFTIAREEIPNNKPKVSKLSELINIKGRNINPFAEDYSIQCGKGLPDAINIKIWIPFIKQEAIKPMSIIVKRTANVEEVIGYILYQYIEENRTPLPSKSLSVYSLRIVEDDGSIDDDFPG
jgi:hypothetical protein